jgi:hypothetical protein
MPMKYTLVLMRNAICTKTCSVLLTGTYSTPWNQSTSVCTCGQLHVHKLYPTSAHWQAWWVVVAKTEIPILTENRPRSHVLRVDNFPGHIFSKYNNRASEVCVCRGGGGQRRWTTRVNNLQLWRSIVSEVLWLYSCGLAAMALLAYGVLLLRQSMTCSLFVRLVGLHRYWLADSVHSDRKKDDIVFPHMVSIGCVFNDVATWNTKQCWCLWNVLLLVCLCQIYSLISRPQIVFMSRHVCAMSKTWNY